MAPSPKPAPKIDPPSTVALEENRGLAQRLLELRNELAEQHAARGREIAELRGIVARIADRQKAIDTKLDQLKTEWDRDLRAIQTQKRDMDEDVRKSGELARKMTEHMAVLDELRESQPDLDQVLGPIKRSVQQVALDLEAYKKNQDGKWEQLPRQRQKPAETRDGDEVLQRHGEKLRKLTERVEALEGG
jgi:chromosome segregation ATPase